MCPCVRARARECAVHIPIPAAVRNSIKASHTVSTATTRECNIGPRATEEKAGERLDRNVSPQKKSF